MTHNIIFRAEHIPGMYNTLADPLPRLQVNLFLSRTKGVDHYTTSVPNHLLSNNYILTSILLSESFSDSSNPKYKRSWTNLFTFYQSTYSPEPILPLSSFVSSMCVVTCEVVMKPYSQNLKMILEEHCRLLMGF